MSTTQAPAAGMISRVSPGYQDLVFWYQLSPSIPSGGSVVTQFQVDNDSDFEWRWLIGTSILTTGVAGLASVTLTDRYTARPLMTANINLENLMGTAQLPFTLPKPYILRRTSSIQGSFTDRSIAGVNNNVQLCFVGYKLSS